MLTQKVYQNYGRFIAQTIIDKVTPIMKEKKPGAIVRRPHVFLKPIMDTHILLQSDIGFTKVDLGKQIPRMSNFIVHNTEPGIIVRKLILLYFYDLFYCLLLFLLLYNDYDNDYYDYCYYDY